MKTRIIFVETALIFLLIVGVGRTSSDLLSRKTVSSELSAGTYEIVEEKKNEEQDQPIIELTNKTETNPIASPEPTIIEAIEAIPTPTTTPVIEEPQISPTETPSATPEPEIPDEPVENPAPTVEPTPGI